MESKFDYLRLTLKPEKKNAATINDAMELLYDRFLLGSLIDKMILQGCTKFYGERRSYEHCSLYLPKDDEFSTQGLCLEFSGQGLEYFCGYLHSYKLELRDFFQMWRCLCFEGWISKCTRIDYAMDDICYNGNTPVLTMRRVLSALEKDEYSSRSKDVGYFDDIAKRSKTKKVNGKKVKGTTISIGSRESDTYCRFYDKLAEQIQKKQPVKHDITSWNRCEFEFKGSSAMCVFNAFCDYSSNDFSDYIKGQINGHIRFITRNSNNISRCSAKRWWITFLGGCTSRLSFSRTKPARSALARSLRWIRLQVLPTIFTLIHEWGIHGFNKFVTEEIKEQVRKGKYLYISELGRNIRENRLYTAVQYEELIGFTNHLYHSGLTSLQLIKNIKKQHWENTKHYLYATKYGIYDEIHNNFMIGQVTL